MKYVLALGLMALSTPALAQSSAEMRFVKNLFAQIQGPSFQSNREYCGYIGYDEQGRLAASTVVRGGRDECEPRWPEQLNVIASFHTHAGFDREAWSEFPSVTDIEADEAEGVDGWLATPGGRLWYIDTQDMVVSQVCGTGCLPQDPKFRPGVHGQVDQSYTYRQLLRLESSN